MGRKTNADRRAIRAAREGDVSPEVVELVQKKVAKVVKEAPKPVAKPVAKPAPETPKPAVKKPARVVKKAAKKVEAPKVVEPVAAAEPDVDVGAKNVEILGEDKVLEDKTVAELRDIASDIDVDDRSKLKRKADLIDGIKSDDDWVK